MLSLLLSANCCPSPGCKMLATIAQGVPIFRTECPNCGERIKIGIPVGAEVEGIASSANAVPDGEGQRRVVACPLGHEIHVYFIT